MSVVEDLEFKLARIKEFREQSDKAMRLSKNPDFQELIIRGFCRDEVARLAGMSTDPGQTDPNFRASCLNAAQAGGVLKRFMTRLIDQAYEAEKEVPQIEEILEHERAKEAARDTSSTAGPTFTTLGGEELDEDYDSAEV